MSADKKKTSKRASQTVAATEEFFQIDQNNIVNQAAVQADEIKNDDWLEESFDGQLSVDVFQTGKEIIIKSTIAGVKPEDIDISINKDMVTIRGRRREDEVIPEENYLYRECYWGGFSRSIILPIDVRADKVAATLKNGILTVVLPKAAQPKTRSIKVKEEE